MKQLYMKNEMQQTKNIKDVFTENEHQNFNTKTNHMKRSMASASDKGKRAAIELNIFLTQNKGKGPPGRQRSPGINKAVSFADSCGKSLSSIGAKSKTINSVIDNTSIKKLDDYKIYNYKFLIHSSNFNVMKKQFLFLILAIFASVTVAFGQSAVNDPLVTPENAGSCTSDPLHPIAGKPYVYQATASNPATGNYTWWTTKNPVFITGTASAMTSMNNTAGNVLTVAGGDLLSATTNYNVADPSNQVGIIWSTKTLANTKYQTNPTFVTVYFEPTAGSGCADNIKVYEIDPRNAFTVDILNLDETTKAPLTYGATETQCVADVTSAKYLGGHQVDYLYGVNTLYFEVVAANFTGSWKPNFKFTGLTGNSDQAAVAEWSYDKTFPAATTYPIDIATGATSSVSTSVSDTSIGVSIYVRLTITNNHFETLAMQAVTVAVDGTNEAGEWDVVNSTCTPPAAPDWVDLATQQINPRPTITPNTTGTGSTPPNTTLIPQVP